MTGPANPPRPPAFPGLLVPLFLQDRYQRVQQICATSPPPWHNIDELGPFRLLTRGDQLPVFAFTLQDHISGYSVFDVSAALREHGWLVPAYTFPEHRTELAVLRIVVRNGFTHDLAAPTRPATRHRVQLLLPRRQPIPTPPPALIHARRGVVGVCGGQAFRN